MASVSPEMEDRAIEALSILGESHPLISVSPGTHLESASGPIQTQILPASATHQVSIVPSECPDIEIL